MDIKKQILNNFADYCHQFYLGDKMNKDGWQFIYKQDIDNMVKGFLNKDRN